MTEALVTLILTGFVVGGVIAAPRIAWSFIKMVVVFAIMLVALDGVNDFLAGYVLDTTSAMVNTFTWIWFYFRMDLLFAFVGPIYALSVLAKVFARS